MSRNDTERSTQNPDRREPETIDGATGELDPTPASGNGKGKAPRRIDLSNLRDVRIEMAHVYRQVDAEQIESSEGSRRVYMLRQIADVITIAELEKRIEELEQTATPTAAGDHPGAALPAPTLN